MSRGREAQTVGLHPPVGPTDFGRLLRCMRVTAGRSLTQDARELGMESSELSGIENGCVPVPADLHRWIAVLYLKPNAQVQPHSGPGAKDE